MFVKTIKSIPVIVGLLLVDVAGILISFYLATQARLTLIRLLGGEVYWPVYLPMVYLAIGVLTVFFAFSSLYPGYGLSAVIEMERIVKQITLMFIFLGVSIFAFKVYSDFPRSIFFISWLISIILIPMGRFAFRNQASLFASYGIPILGIIESIDNIQAIEALRNSRRMGWKPLALLIQDGSASKKPDIDLPILDSWEDFNKIKLEHSIDTVLVSYTDATREKDLIRPLSNQFKRLIFMHSTETLGSVSVQPRDLEGSLGLEVRYQLLEPFALIIKQVIDYTFGGLLLVFTIPLMLFFSILIRLESPGPVFFQQERLGKGQKKFNVIKFRTMTIDAEQRLPSLLKNDPIFALEYERYHKLLDDPRVTRVGKWLRKFSLDELPQLWNVVRGEMGLIGPRAYLPSELGKMGDFTDLILRIKPGMTGWWQVMGRQTTFFERRLILDEYYISNWSPWMDFYVLLKTFWVIIQGKGI